MPVGALIDTSNRLLGWSTNDFSLYGGQPAMTIGAPAAPSSLSNGLSIADPNPARSPSPDTGSSPQEAIAQEAPLAASEAPSAFHAMPFALAPIQFGGTTHANDAAAVVPAATSSGSPVLPVETLHSPAMASSGFAPPTLAVEQPAVEGPALAPVSGLAAPVLAATGETLDHLVSTVGTATDTLLGDTQHDLDALPNTLDAVLDTSPLTAMDGFLGSDPVGGVATLVSMVDSADAFDLTHSGLDIPQVAAAGSIVDALADDALVGPLLGDVEHGVDTVLPDHDHHDGVLGLL